MSGQAPGWGATSRFYLPNEDARLMAEALRLLGARATRPAFVGGSGMALFVAASALPDLERADFVDVAAFQVGYVARLRQAIGESASPQALRDWFAREVHPQLCDHYRARGADFPLEKVFAALKDLFGVELFFEPQALDLAKRVAARTRASQADMADWLARPGADNDFVCLSNVPDYLTEAAQRALFAACRNLCAPVYLLATTACPDPAALERAWRLAGYRPHPAGDDLDAANRGLGSPGLKRPWNRLGRVWLLVSD